MRKHKADTLNAGRSTVEIEKKRLELFCKLLSGRFDKLNDKFAEELKHIRLMEASNRKLSVH